MPTVDSQALYKKLDKGHLDPIYFFYGEESYLSEQASKRVVTQGLENNLPDFNYNLFYASDCEVDAVRDAVETLPMMGSRRVVFLKGAHALTDKEWEKMEPLFENPVDSCIFLIQADKIDKRKRSIKKLMDVATSVEFKRPFENQFPEWIKIIAKGHNVELTGEAVAFIHRMAGGQLRDIDSEIQKLKIYLGDRKRAELADVAQVISRSREDSIFEFVESLARRDRISALYGLVRLLDQGESEIAIVSLIARHLRILGGIHQGMKENLSGPKLAQYVGVSPYFLHQYQEQSRIWSLKRLDEAMLLLADTEKALKSSPLSSHIWLENMILKMTSEG